VTSSLYDTFNNEFGDAMSITHQRRLQAYRKYWLYYLGQHWSYARDEGEAQVTFNYSRRLVDLHTNFTFKKGFKVTVPDDPTTDTNEKNERDFVRKMLQETWRKNDMKTWCLQLGQMGGVTGDAFIRVSWDDTVPLEEPFARANIIPSHFCFPDVGTGIAGDDISQLRRMLIMLPMTEEVQIEMLAARGFSQMNRSPTTHRVVFLMEEWTNPVLDPITKAVLKPAMFRLWRGRDLIEERENPIGVIPVVHISNYPLAGEYYGISDLSDILDLNRELNEKATDISDIINYHGSPITIVEGAKLKDLEKGVNRVWAIPEGASVKNLALEGDLAAANKYYDTLKDTALEMSSTPPQALGQMQNVSNTSGVAMYLQYLPLLEKRDVKTETYGSGIEKVNRLIIRVNELADPEFSAELSMLSGNKYRNEVVFPDPMPQDERRQLEISREKLEMGLSNKRKELEAMGKSQAEITEILEGALDDLIRETKLATEFGESPFNTGPGSGNAQLQRGGANETRGEKIVETATSESGD
jgi:hypothetical protein